MSDAELIELIQIVLDGRGTEVERDRTIARLQRVTGCPEISDYIYHPAGDWYRGDAPTAAEIVARARRTRTILL